MVGVGPEWRLLAGWQEKSEEVDKLTMALQSAILEQKGVAEATKKWRAFGRG